MKFKCCQCAISSFMITDTTLSFCPRLGDKKYPFIENYNGETDFIEKYITAREQYLKTCKENPNILEKCNKCPLFLKSEWDESFGIDYIGVANRSKCSCNCIYCTSSSGNIDKRKELNRKEVWDIKPVLMMLEKNKLLKNTGTLFIAGGECSEYPKEELQWLFDFAYRNNFNLNMASSGMFYSKEIEQALRNWKTELLVSVDSGTKEKYEQIKRVNFYDKVWDNLKNYIKASENNPDSVVSIKYIILDGINDSIEEFQQFINKCDSVNCKHIDISLDIDYIFSLDINHNDIPSKTMELLEYIRKLKDERIYSDVYCEMKEIKTSAKIYSEEIERALSNGNICLSIVIFAGLNDTYRKITNTDMHDNIWENILKYSGYTANHKSFRSEIRVQYKIIPDVNDSTEEIEAFLENCNKCDIDNIEIGLYSNNNKQINPEKLMEIKKIVSKQNNNKILFSNELM